MGAEGVGEILFYLYMVFGVVFAIVGRKRGLSRREIVGMLAGFLAVAALFGAMAFEDSGVAQWVLRGIWVPALFVYLHSGRQNLLRAATRRALLAAPPDAVPSNAVRAGIEDELDQGFSRWRRRAWWVLLPILLPLVAVAFMFGSPGMGALTLGLTGLVAGLAWWMFRLPSDDEIGRLESAELRALERLSAGVPRGLPDGSR